MKQHSLKQLQKQVEEFNSNYPIGTPVRLVDSASNIETKVRTEAQIMGGHSAVAWFEGVSGCWDVSYVKPI
jgi:hypothetical protein